MSATQLMYNITLRDFMATQFMAAYIQGAIQRGTLNDGLGTREAENHIIDLVYVIADRMIARRNPPEPQSEAMKQALAEM